MGVSRQCQEPCIIAYQPALAKARTNPSPER
jgi:hypothetical protein